MGQLKKSISSDKNTVFSVIDATDAVAESMERLDAYPPSMAHLGQAMMGAALVHSLWNEKGQVEKVALQWKVDGPFGHLFSDSNQQGHIRGTILSPQAPIDNYETGLGTGHLQVQRLVGKEITGIIEAQGNVCDDILEYLAQSEQRNCTMSLSVKIGRSKDNPEKLAVEYALGYLIDVLPQEDLNQTRKVLEQWDNYLQSLGPISEWKLPEEKRLDSMLHLLSPGDPLKELMFQKIQFQCNCSEDRASRAAKLSEKLAPDDKVDGPLNVQCEFCGKVYVL